MTTPKNHHSTILSKNTFPVVGIGASAGGLDAFQKFVRALSHGSGAAYIIVQHLSPEHESSLPQILQKDCQIPVVEISDNLEVRPDHLYVIPSNKLLTVNDGILELSARPTDHKLLNSIDIFFSSLAEVHRNFSIAVILSGSGKDGTAGLKAIKDQGGLTIAQDPASAAFKDMPQHAIEAGVVDFILLAENIPGELLDIIDSHNASDDAPMQGDQQESHAFAQIIVLLRQKIGVDFSLYKQPTIKRRIFRRVGMNQISTLKEYLALLKKDPAELSVLFDDLLIPVTSFFRDPATFDNLCESVLHQIIPGKFPEKPIRVWVAGCSTGQEAYSIAICLHEYLEKHELSLKVQIFATDLSERVIKKARSGIYTKNEMTGLSKERQRKYFTDHDKTFQVIKTIRDMCIFARHNFLNDPPFVKIDLITCRNVLIYLEPYLQNKVLETFHYALNGENEDAGQQGILWLGKSETTGSASDLFVPLSKKEKFYKRKKSVSTKYKLANNARHLADLYTPEPFVLNGARKTESFQKNADDILLAKYTPAGAIVNAQYDIVQFRGATGDFLEPAPGKASLNILKMVRQGLAFETRNALNKAKIAKDTVIKAGIPVNGNLLITIEVIPLLNPIELHFLILFTRTENRGALVQSQGKQASRLKNDGQELRIISLEKELAQARVDMRNISDDQEIDNEELQSANEELLSGSEELQSLNEELETSKEELQSTNEELITLNQELDDRNEELILSQKFAETTISLLHEPLLILDRNNCIKSANDSFYKTFKISEKETLNQNIFELQGKGWNIPQLHVELSKIKTGKQKKMELEILHDFPNLGERHICINIQLIEKDNGEQLIMLALEDITLRVTTSREEKLITEKIRVAEEFSRSILQSSPDCVKVLDKHGRIIFLNANGLGKLEINDLHEVENTFWWDMWNEEDKEMIYQVIQKGLHGEIAQFQASFPTAKGNKRWWDVMVSPISKIDGAVTELIAVSRDITDQRLLESAIRESEARLRQMADSMPQNIWTSDTADDFNYFNTQLLDFSGLALDELKDYGWKSIVHPQDWEANEEIWKLSFREKADFTVKHRLLRFDKVFRWHLCRAHPLLDAEGKVTFWIATNTDIHEEQLFADELIKQVAEREILDEQKNSFISMASHELKTPVTSIKGYAQVLVNKFRKEGNTDDLGFVVRMNKQLDHLTRLINDLLDTTKVNGGSLVFIQDFFDLNELVTEMTADMQQTSSSHLISSTLAPTPLVFGDRNRIGQVITNILSNAIKYSPDAKSINISVSQNHEKVEFTVEDFGIGIPLENQVRIFDQFYRAGGLNQYNFSGLGLGLYISAQIITRHHGQMSVKSVEGKGSTIGFTIPSGKVANTLSNH